MASILQGGVNILFHGVTDYDSSTPLTYVEMALGDTVFFHPLLIHGSGMNRTTEFRKVLHAIEVPSYLFLCHKNPSSWP